MIPVHIIRQVEQFDYNEALQLQKELFNKALLHKSENQTVENYLIFCEHTPVYTLGKRTQRKNLLFDESNPPAPIVKIGRGGDVTYHGPGQLVAYPIFDLEQFGMGLKEYIHLLEQIVIQTIAQYGIKGESVPHATGVWIEQTRKICAIGVKASRYITMHGFALNVSTDLNYFNHIIPCGISDKEVTSIEKECNHSVSIIDVEKNILENFINNFNVYCVN